MVTGPGGVLWGANSFLGIVNVITKDADDVNGLELSAGYGDGRGNKQDSKAYALFGKSFLERRAQALSARLVRELRRRDVHRAAGASRCRRRPVRAGPPTSARRSARCRRAAGWLIVDGKYSLGPVSLYYMLPFGDIYTALGVNGGAAAPGRPVNIYDRYGVLEYNDRYLRRTLRRDGARPTTRSSCASFHFQLFPPSAVAPAFTTASGKPNVGGLQLDFAGQIFSASAAPSIST